MDAEQLENHLKQTCDMIRRHRGRILPGGVGYQDNPTFGGFGPKLPFSEHAMELADLEAAFVGNLARYCMAMGTIPQRPRKGFWWVNGECKGIKGGMDEDEYDMWGNPNGHDYLVDIRELIDHLRTWAPSIIKTEGVEELLSAGEDIRWYSLKMFPQEDDKWISEEEAKNRTGRNLRTLQRWRESGVVEFFKDNWGVMYLERDLDLIAGIKRENMLRGMER